MQEAPSLVGAAELAMLLQEAPGHVDVEQHEVPGPVGAGLKEDPGLVGTNTTKRPWSSGC